VRLVVISQRGKETCDWGSYALLRDNVQHFVEGGQRSGRFRALHQVATAVDRGTCTVDAVQLRVEVLKAWSALQRVRLGSAAVSSRTLAIRKGKSVPPRDAVTRRVRRRTALLPVSGSRSTRVPTAARSFMAAVLCLTSSATAGETLEIWAMEGNGPLALRPGPD
jgi:hypothetical protein